MERAFKETIEQVFSGKAPGDSILLSTGRLLSGRVSEDYRAAKSDFSTSDAEMITRLTRDVWQFSAAKNYQQLRDMTLALRNEEGKLREWDDYVKAVEETGVKYNKTWMRTEYNSSVAGATSAARWVEFQRDADSIPNLKYQTVGDDHVRASHQVLDGIIRPIDDEFWDTHYPPNGWGCRCEALQSPRGQGRITENLPASPVPSMFQTNFAKTGIIFPKNHPYYVGIPKSELRKSIAWLPPENTFLTWDFGDDKLVDIHPLHGEKELKKNIDAVDLLLKYKPDARIQIMPIIEEKDAEIRSRFLPKEYLQKFPLKNPDIKINESLAEIEVPGGSKRSIQHAIEHGIKQADTVFIHIPSGVSIDDAYRIVNGHIKQYYADTDAKIYLLNETELRLYKKQGRQ